VARNFLSEVGKRNPTFFYEEPSNVKPNEPKPVEKQAEPKVPVQVTPALSAAGT